MAGKRSLAKTSPPVGPPLTSTLKALEILDLMYDTHAKCLTQDETTSLTMARNALLLIRGIKLLDMAALATRNGLAIR